MPKAAWVAAPAAILIVAAASAQNIPMGYLQPGQFDILAVIPAAPTVGDAHDRTDRGIFRETRALEGTPRWALAASDGEIGPGPEMKVFSCAMGIEATPAEAPKLVAMLGRVMGDVAPAMTVAKDHFQRRRPYHIDQGPTCRDTGELGDSYDFPSGHAMYGWAWATILAQALPDRATPIMARGRAYGESRYICGVHNYSAVEAGWFATSSIMALQSSTAEYRNDLDGVRIELEGLRNAAHTPDPARCEAESQALGG